MWTAREVSVSYLLQQYPEALQHAFPAIDSGLLSNRLGHLKVIGDGATVVISMGTEKYISIQLYFVLNEHI